VKVGNELIVNVKADMVAEHSKLAVFRWSRKR